MMNRNSMKPSVGLWGALIIGVALVSCGRPQAERVIIVNTDSTTVAGGTSVVTFGIVAGVFQPDVCQENNVFVFRAAATACGQTGMTGQAYQVGRDMKFKDIGTADLTKSDEEIAGTFGIKEPIALKRMGFTYPR